MQTVRLQVDGISCAACTTRIEAALAGTPGLASIHANPATAEVRATLDPARLGVPALLERIRALGFEPHPVGSDGAEAARREERRAALKRLAAAGFGMMQTMMFAFALYASDEYRMDPALVGLMRYSSLLVAVPVTAYAGAPIFRAAWHQARSLRPAMDVPVGLGLLLALAASVLHTFEGRGSVYYDSVTMFLFFLGVARFVEMTTRHRVGSAGEALAALLPRTVLRLRQGVSARIPLAELAAGDEVLVNRGDRVPADGTIVEGSSAFDESLLTGESRPVARRGGDPVTGGSVNLGHGVRMRVTATGASTEVAAIVRLLEQSRRRKPRVLGLADRASRVFSAAILLLALVVCAAWLAVRPEEAFSATIAVLVVACPCALALAAPAVVASANGALARLGLLPVSADAIEQLADVRHVVVDKTGTLTVGQPRARLRDNPRRLPEAGLLAVAAALERASSHPLAEAFRAYEDATVVATDVTEHAGAGVAGTVGGRAWRLGRAGYAGPALEGTGDDAVVLADTEGVVATFAVEDNVRPDVRPAVDTLRALGCSIEIMSGDAPATVAHIAGQVGIADWHARMTPAAKVAGVEARQRAGQPVLMIGDGINDAPTLAAAHASIALQGGSALAQTSADLVMLDRAWAALPQALEVSARARAILRQNLAWAACYNLAATPLAALGYVPPWLAALGMSVSSLVVVLNARRAGRLSRRAPGGDRLRIGDAAVAGGPG